MAPDWALIITVAVPRFAGVLLLYPPQPAIARPVATIAIAAVAVVRKGQSVRTFPLLDIARLHNPKPMTSAHGPIMPGVNTPKCEIVAEVVTVNLVLAPPLAGVTVAGLKLQVIPETGRQEKVTLFAKPPVGVTVSMNCVDWPAITDALPGAAAIEKSELAMSSVTPGEVLAPNFPSPP